MKKIILSFILFLSAQAMARTEICPQPTPTDIAPHVDVSVKTDKKAGLYTYKYTLSNAVSAKVPIWKFTIEADSAPVEIQSPKGWEKGVYDKSAKEIHWSYAGKDSSIAAGVKLEGFVVVSKKAPGLVKAYAEGDAPEVPSVKFDNDEEESDPGNIACPGFFNGEGNEDSSVMATEGPAISNRVEIKIRIKKPESKFWAGSPHLAPEIEISPVDYGQLDLMIFGNQNLDVNKIDYKTIVFGPGEAKFIPVKKAILQEFKDTSDNEIFQYLLKNKAQHMTLSFNLQEIGVRCNIENSLFLTAKMGDKTLMGAVNLIPAPCDAKTFEREGKKDKYHKTNKK
ncbi:MAG: hypothetical protein ACXVAX_12675 [Pseudobdellovibrio sp.]